MFSLPSLVGVGIVELRFSIGFSVSLTKSLILFTISVSVDYECRMSLILFTRSVKSFDSVGPFVLAGILGAYGALLVAGVVADGVFLLVGATFEGFVAYT